MSFFEAKNISCIRGNKLVFKNLNFKGYGGELIVIKGANGSGKSSLLKILCGLLKPTSGSIKFSLTGRDGDEIKSNEEFLIHIDYVGHENALKNAFTVKENLIFYHKLKKKETFKHPLYPGITEDMPYNRLETANSIDIEKDLLISAAKKFNLQNLLDVKVENLSSGEKRRVSLSKLYLTFVPKRIWLLDEPTNNLDKKNSNFFLKLLKEHASSADTLTIITSHDDIKIKNKNTITL